MEALLTSLLAALIWLYYQCAFFMVNVAGLLGVTYRDSNAALFFILWPLLTLNLIGWVLWNQWQIFRLKRTESEA